mgnify:CR=1 FL=1
MKKEFLNIPKNMQAIEIEEFGKADNLKLCVRPTPQISNNQVLIKVSFAGVNRPDILQRQGNYKVPDGASDLPGLEVSGIVVDIKDSNLTFNVGDKVCALCHGGGYAEYVSVDIGHCKPVPRNYSMQEAACIPETFITVWSNLFIRGKLSKNEKVLIHGGASGIGTTAIQLAKEFGTTVYATAGSDKKCSAVEKLGASKCINYRNSEFENEINELTNNKGVDVKSHMSPVDDDVRNLIMAEFSKDKMLVDRFRKEQVRKEIHDTRLKEKQESKKKLQLLSLQEQRDLEKKERLDTAHKFAYKFAKSKNYKNYIF